MAISFWGLMSDAVMSASWLELGVLLILLAMSVISWAVIIMKIALLRRARANNEHFRVAFETYDHTGQVAEEGRKDEAGPAPLYAIFTAAIASRQDAREDAKSMMPVPNGEFPLRSPRQLAERVRLAMDHARRAEFTRLSKHLNVLASAGSASPFIGLFGTVWGILATFQTLGAAKSASLQALGPPIAAALIATAAGLAVAIPAVMAYNWFVGRIDEEQEEAQCFEEDLARLLRANGAMNEPGSSAQTSQPLAKSA